MRKRESETSLFCGFTPQTPTTGGAEPGQNLEPGTQSGSPIWKARTQRFEPSPTAFQDVLHQGAGEAAGSYQWNWMTGTMIQNVVSQVASLLLY